MPRTPSLIKRKKVVTATASNGTPETGSPDSTIASLSSSTMANTTFGVDKYDDKGSVVVAVRVRPLPDSDRSKDNLAVKMTGNTVTILPPSSPSMSGATISQSYSFDHAYWSVHQSGPTRFATQETVYADIGRTTLHNSLKGYNCCILAYGQTGSGKSYSMFGDENENRKRRSRDTSPTPRIAKMRTGPSHSSKGAGIIPRIIEDLYAHIDSRPDIKTSVEVTYYQIYLERVTCLLNADQGVLKVREHPLTGPYVEDLTCLIVDSKKSLLRLLDSGNKARVVTNTKQNMVSSRSHAVITLSITQQNAASNSSTSSKLSLIDLAGSERVSKSGSSGIGVVEASAINQSLSSLGKVISILGSSRKRAAATHVPYRDSVLTWLLKESLGGNSKTTMLATISSSQRDREESLSTLRYADQAKRIVNRAVVNDQVSNKKIAAQLKSEIKNLQQQLHKGADVVLQQQLVQSQKLMQQMSRTWDEKWQLTQKVLHEKEAEATKLQQDKDNMSLEIKRLSKELNKTQQERDTVAEEAKAKVERLKSEMNRLHCQYSKMEQELKQPQPQPPQQPSSLGLIKEIRESAASIRDTFKASPRPSASTRNPSPSSRPTRSGSISCNSTGSRAATASTSTEREQPSYLVGRSSQQRGRDRFSHSDSYTSPAVASHQTRPDIRHRLLASGYASSSYDDSSDSDLDTETETMQSDSPPPVSRSRNNSLSSVPTGSNLNDSHVSSDSFLTDRTDRMALYGINRLPLSTSHNISFTERELTPRLKSSFFDGPRPGSPSLPARVSSPKLQTDEMKRRSEEDERWKKWLEDKKKRAGQSNSIMNRSTAGGSRPTSVATQKATGGEGGLSKSRPSTPLPIRRNTSGSEGGRSSTFVRSSSQQMGNGESQSLRSASQLASHLSGLEDRNRYQPPVDVPPSKKTHQPVTGDDLFQSARPLRSPRPQPRAPDENSSSGLTDETVTNTVTYQPARRSPRPQSLQHTSNYDDGEDISSHLRHHQHPIDDHSTNRTTSRQHQNDDIHKPMRSPRPGGDDGRPIRSPRPATGRYEDASNNNNNINKHPVPVVVPSNGASSGSRLRGSSTQHKRSIATKQYTPSDTDSSTETSSYCSDDSDGSTGSRLSIKRITEENTCKAIKDSELVRRRIDDDYRRQKLGLASLTTTQSNNSSILSDKKKLQTVSFQEHPTYIDCASLKDNFAQPQKYQQKRTGYYSAVPGT